VVMTTLEMNVVESFANVVENLPRPIELDENM
jgi:hypothetical protein